MIFLLCFYTLLQRKAMNCATLSIREYSDKDYGPVTNVKYCRFKKRIAVLLLPHELFLSYVFVAPPITNLC